MSEGGAPAGESGGRAGEGGLSARRHGVSLQPGTPVSPSLDRPVPGPRMPLCCMHFKRQARGAPGSAAAWGLHPSPGAVSSSAPGVSPDSCRCGRFTNRNEELKPTRPAARRSAILGRSARGGEGRVWGRGKGRAEGTALAGRLPSELPNRPAPEAVEARPRLHSLNVREARAWVSAPAGPGNSPDCGP